VRIQRGVHPDVVIVEPGDNGAIRIDQIREVVERTAYRPFEGRRRVVVIDEADALMAPAQNALLKTLEEPPSLSVFILVTTRPGHAAADGPFAMYQAAVHGAGRGRRSTSRRARSRTVCWCMRRRRLIPAGASRARRNCSRKPARAVRPIAISCRRISRPWRRSCATVEVLAAGADAATLANLDAKPALERLVPSFKGDRGLAAVFGHRPRSGSARPQLGRQGRGRLAGAAAMSAPASGPLVAVKLTPVGRAQTFLPGDLPGDSAPRPGDRVVVHTDGGPAVGTVVRRIPQLDDKRRPAADSPQRVVRLASRDDVLARLKHQHREQDAHRIALLKIRERGLGMKLTRVEQAFDGSKLVFYFTADGRVDFRELVRELASEFRTRIEMRQIGVRDEAKMFGGYGTCGRPLCCTTFLQTFEPVSIKMAKQQDLSLNPSKLSGLCGRLKCCLRYELPNAKGGAAWRLRQRRRAATILRGAVPAAAADPKGVGSGGCGSCAH
jgi:cell fate regulator YaaT (PSP1 superfamily)